MAEKRIYNLPMVRVEESLYLSLSQSAAAEERTLSEYLRRLLWKHEFGHARRVGDRGEPVTDFGALQGDARD